MQLGYRFSHVMRRMLPIAMHLLAKDGEGLTGHELFLKRLGASFHNFVEEAEAATRARSTGPPPGTPTTSHTCLQPRVGQVDLLHEVHLAGHAGKLPPHVCAGAWRI